MSSTRFDVYVFDLDGTLVQSAGAKRQAFFDIFEADHAAAVGAVLAADPDGSRYAVIPRMLEEIGRRGMAAPPSGVDALLEGYGRIAARLVEEAPEIPGAATVLRTLARHAAVYIASVTPHEQLVALLARRGWLDHLAGVFGYPDSKPAVVAGLLSNHAITPDRLLVVGDGPSDAEAAAGNGCPFHLIAAPADLMKVPGLTTAGPVAAIHV